MAAVAEKVTYRSKVRRNVGFWVAMSVFFCHESKTFCRNDQQSFTYICLGRIVLMTTPCSNEVWERRYLGGRLGFTILSPRECKSGYQVGTQYSVYHIFQRWGENNHSLSLQPVESSFKSEGETGKGDLSYWDLGQWLHGGKREVVMLERNTRLLKGNKVQLVSLNKTTGKHVSKTSVS